MGNRRLCVIVMVVTVAATGTGCGSTRRVASRPPVPSPPGFAAETGQLPIPGGWVAVGRTIFTRGYKNDYLGHVIVRNWRITDVCVAASGCSDTLTREYSHDPPSSARLIYELNGWHATFPKVHETCSQDGPILWQWEQENHMVLRFTDGGRGAEANETNYSESPACGYGEASLKWSAHHVAKRLPIHNHAVYPPETR
jgi:hypothetical protein